MKVIKKVAKAWSGRSEKISKTLGLITILLILILASCISKTKQTSELKNKPAAKKQPLILPKLKYNNAYNGTLYLTSEKIGDDGPMDLLFKNIDKNGVTYIISYFGIEPDDDDEDTEFIKETIKDHPSRVIPFFSPGFGSEETEPLVGEKLTKIYKDGFAIAEKALKSQVLKGIGEVETHDWDMLIYRQDGSESSRKNRLQKCPSPFWQRSCSYRKISDKSRQELDKKNILKLVGC